MAIPPPADGPIELAAIIEQGIDQILAGTPRAQVIESLVGSIERAVREAKSEAERANEAKSDFLSRMSHELRTPLNAILGFGQLLEIEKLSARQQESVDQIVRAGRHLLELVNEVLDLARIETGQITVAPEPLAICDLAHEATDLVRPQALARHVELILHHEDESCRDHVLADRQRLLQVLSTLLSNAVRFNRDGGRVTLGIRPSPAGGKVEIRVTDTGPGIPPEKLARLFVPFERPITSGSGDAEGTGVSLALSQRLIEAMHGSLAAESREGEGTTFIIELALAAALQPDLAPADLLEGILPDFGAAPASGRTVLHIEDSESNRHLVEMLVLQRPAVSLVSAASGKGGLQLAQDCHPDLILLDMHLPDIPGNEVLTQLRAGEDTRQIPVVIISADATAARARQLKEAGASQYLTKPFQVSQFLRVLDDHLTAR